MMQLSESKFQGVPLFTEGPSTQGYHINQKIWILFYLAQKSLNGNQAGKQRKKLEREFRQ